MYIPGKNFTLTLKPTEAVAGTMTVNGVAILSQGFTMAFPYVSDALNFYLGTNLRLPIATFGTFVALAILIAARITTHEVTRLQGSGAFDRPSSGAASFLPSDTIGKLTVVAVLAGMLGAKLFDAIERADELLSDPLGVLFSTGGFSIYGGLLVGGAAGALLVRRQSISLVPMLDSFAPALALGYAIGRLGCQFSGDGDWGKQAAMELKPTWLPDWWWAQTYDNNVLGIVIPNPGVYPTPLYEAFASFALFLLLWSFRKRLKTPGVPFSLYLIFSGLQRLLIEKIRINIEYSIFGIEITQAQLISIALIIVGSIGILKISQFSHFSRMLFSMFILGTLTACTVL